MSEMELFSLHQLFNSYIFRIPDYQRGYSWTTPQLVDFWEDLINLDQNKTHYCGMLTIKVEPKANIEGKEQWINESWLVKDSDYNVCYVIDGQQRLTTSIILINEILSAVENDEDFVVNNKTPEDLKRHFIVEPKKGLESRKCYKFGYIYDDNSSNYLKATIFGLESNESEESYYTHNLKTAKTFFCDRIKECLAKHISLKVLFKKLINGFGFNLFPINNGFEDILAFETMNNRGKKLSTLEILKNRLIYLISQMDMPEDDIMSSRQKINEAWSEIYKQLGKNPENLLEDDEYLRDHWILYYNEYSSRKGYDYSSRLLNTHFNIRNVEGHETFAINEPEADELQDNDQESVDYTIDEERSIPQEKTSDANKLTSNAIMKYVESIKDLSKYWYYLHEPESKEGIMGENIVYQINRLNRVGINYFKPLVLACLHSTEEESSKENLLKNIERFIFIYFRLAQNNAGSYKNKFYTLASELYYGKITIAAVSEELSSLIEDQKSTAMNRFMSYMDSRFKNGDGFYDWTRPLKYLLFEYEEHLANGRDAKIQWNKFVRNTKDRTTSIEHILPQNPGDGWEEFNQYDETELKCLTNSLGNILALETRINSSLQNSSYKDKLEGNGRPGLGYKNGSHSEVEVANEYPEWTAMAIKTRGLKLLNFMIEHWNLDPMEDAAKINLLGLGFLCDD